MDEIIRALSNFQADVRNQALREVIQAIRQGRIKPSGEYTGWLNLHLHTFHSFNYKGWSPSRLMFEAWKTKLEWSGTIDFDTLAGLEETTKTARLLGIKATGGFESRVFVPEYRQLVINSPKEPGIYYLCGQGFKRCPPENTSEGRFLQNLKGMAQARNRMVVARLNKFLGRVELDYEKDVWPLTPSANPTERHIVAAYQQVSEKVLASGVDRFWSETLGEPEKKIADLRKNRPQDFQEVMRSKLIKFGGPGYVEPEEKLFPRLKEVIQGIEQAGGLPIGTWLDGTSEGEKNPEALLEFLLSQGIKGMAIIPERNWNIRAEKEREVKLAKLKEFLATCEKMKIPVICGTEMNKAGQPFVDDFRQPVLAEYLPFFLESASALFQ
ncbi:MAG: hypothetical protein NC911_01550 [Candidatus Omnitrophica bacterium]|nr:hypothetical protein [Candidatus Omnitrophota bacterium]